MKYCVEYHRKNISFVVRKSERIVFKSKTNESAHAIKKYHVFLQFLNSHYEVAGFFFMVCSSFLDIPQLLEHEGHEEDSRFVPCDQSHSVGGCDHIRIVVHVRW